MDKHYCNNAIISTMSTIYESLPPQVAGEVLGYLRLSSKVILRDGSSPVNYTVRWEWWGHQGVTVNLNVPWKSGSAAEEAVFPLRAGLKSSPRVYERYEGDEDGAPQR